MVADSGGGTALPILQLLLGLFVLATTGFAGWLYRHETWFRNVVFPVVQALTGESPTGRDLRPNGGRFEKTDNRLTELESDIEEIRGEVQEVRDDVNDFSRLQKRHNREIEVWLRRIAQNTDEVDEPDEPLFRGGGNDGDSTDD